MTVLSLSQVTALCLNMSGNADHVATATAVIFAESGGDTQAVCSNVFDARTGRVVCQKNGVPAGPILSRDRGLCQINSLSHAEVSDAQAFDPQQAVGAMFHISSGFVDFHQWTTYTSGAYRRFLPQAQGEAKAQLAGGPSPLTAATAAVGGVLYGAGTAAAGAASGAVDAVSSVPHFLGLLTSTRTWERVLLVVVGIGATIAGAVMLGKDVSPLGDAAASLAHLTAS